MSKYPSPRADFQSVKRNVERHNELIEMPAFVLAVQTAMMEYDRHLDSPPTVDPHTSMCYYQRQLGVSEFVKILFNLAEPAALPPKIPNMDALEPPNRPRRP